MYYKYDIYLFFVHSSQETCYFRVMPVYVNISKTALFFAQKSVFENFAIYLMIFFIKKILQNFIFKIFLMNNNLKFFIIYMLKNNFD